jgi:predicted ATPase
MSEASAFTTKRELLAPLSKGRCQMKIKQLDIKGFRSLKDVSWRPGDLNVVIGQNGTGKSNLLRMLELISASAQGRLSKSIQGAGGMGAIVWDGTASTISFRLSFEGEESQADFAVSDTSEYELEIGRLGNTGSYRVQLEILAHQPSVAFVKSVTTAKIFEREDGKIIYRGEEIDSLGKISAEEAALSLGWALASFSSLPEPARAPSILNHFRDQMAGISVYHDLDVGQNSKIRQAAVARFEKQVEPDGQNLVQVLHTLYTGDREFERNVDAAMHAAFGPDYEKLVFPPAADQRVQLRVRWRTLQREQSAADLSDGTLRFLMLLTILAAPTPPMLIAIDEPETGLHPAMYPIIAEFAVEAASRAQIVFTTHSPQFLDAFTKTRPTATVAKWENGETSLRTIEGDELNYWLAEYSLGSLFESGELEAIS